MGHGVGPGGRGAEAVFFFRVSEWKWRKNMKVARRRSAVVGRVGPKITPAMLGGKKMLLTGLVMLLAITN